MKRILTTLAILVVVSITAYSKVYYFKIDYKSVTQGERVLGMEPMKGYMLWNPSKAVIVLDTEEFQTTRFDYEILEKIEDKKDNSVYLVCKGITHTGVVHDFILIYDRKHGDLYMAIEEGKYVIIIKGTL